MRFVLLFQSRKTIRRLIKTFVHKPIEILYFLPNRRFQNIFNITSKVFCIFNNTPLARWATHFNKKSSHMLFQFVLQFHVAIKEYSFIFVERSSITYNFLDREVFHRIMNYCFIVFIFYFGSNLWVAFCKTKCATISWTECNFQM